MQPGFNCILLNADASFFHPNPATYLRNITCISEMLQSWSKLAVQFGCLGGQHDCLKTNQNPFDILRKQHILSAYLKQFLVVSAVD